MSTFVRKINAVLLIKTHISTNSIFKIENPILKNGLNYFKMVRNEWCLRCRKASGNPQWSYIESRIILRKLKKIVFFSFFQAQKLILVRNSLYNPGGQLGVGFWTFFRSPWSSSLGWEIFSFQSWAYYRCTGTSPHLALSIRAASGRLPTR